MPTQRETLLRFLAFAVALAVLPVLALLRGLSALEFALGVRVADEQRVFFSGGLAVLTVFTTVAAFVVMALLESPMPENGVYKDD